MLTMSGFDNLEDMHFITIDKLMADDETASIKLGFIASI